MGIVCLLLFVQCSNAELSDRIEELEKQVSLAGEQREKELKQLQRQVSGFDTLLVQTKERVESVDANRVEELEKLEQLQQQVNNFDTLLVQTKERVEGVDANRVEELEKLEQLRQQVSGLDTLLIQTKERVEGVDANRVEELEKLEQLRQQVNGFDTLLVQTKEWVESVDANCIEGLEKLEQLQRKVNGLDTILVQTGGRVESLGKNLKNDIGNIRCLSTALGKFHHCLFTLIEEGEMDFDKLIVSDASKSGEDGIKRGEDQGNSLLVTCGAVESVCTGITNLPGPEMPNFVGGSVASTDSESLGSKSFHP